MNVSAVLGLLNYTRFKYERLQERLKMLTFLNAIGIPSNHRDILEQYAGPEMEPMEIYCRFK